MYASHVCEFLPTYNYLQDNIAEILELDIHIHRYLSDDPILSRSFLSITSLTMSSNDTQDNMSMGGETDTSGHQIVRHAQL